MDKNLSNAKTWHLLRHLLNPDKSKLEARQELQRIVHQYDGTTEDLLNDVQLRYLNTGCTEVHPEYFGLDNASVDSPITMGEVRAELNRLRTKTAPGPDSVTNHMLRNLDDESIGSLTGIACKHVGKMEQPPSMETSQPCSHP